jgi:hypothetical protein
MMLSLNNSLNGDRMNMFKKTNRSKAWLLTLLLGLGIVPLARTITRAAAQESKNETRSSWKWEWNDDGWKKRLEIRGRAEFTDDYTDIKGISDGGFVRVEEVRNGTARRLDITPQAGGRLQRTFYLNEQARPLDADARAWVSTILLEAVRQSAIDADRRVQRIFERRGLGGVLEEISLSKGDYARRLYFEALLKNRSLNASALQSVLREAARQISSDHDQAKVLMAALEVITDKNEALPAFFEAVGTIKSDYERRLILSAMLKRSGANREALLGVLKSAAGLSSDYEKSLVLKEAAAFASEDTGLAAAFFQPVATIRSDYEHRGVLSALLKRRGLGPEFLGHMLASAARISSDYEKATFLLEAANDYTNDARLRSAFLQTVETIKSDYERGRVLSALKNR